MALFDTETNIGTDIADLAADWDYATFRENVGLESDKNFVLYRLWTGRLGRHGRIALVRLFIRNTVPETRNLLERILWTVPYTVLDKVICALSTCRICPALEADLLEACGRLRQEYEDHSFPWYTPEMYERFDNALSDISKKYAADGT